MAVLTTMACQTTAPVSQDEKVAAALARLQKKTDGLAGEFEAAAIHALGGSEVFQEVGNQTGVAVLVDGSYGFSCTEVKTEDAAVCEKAAIDSASKKSNLVLLDRGDSTILAVGGSDPGIQVVRHFPANPAEDVDTMFLSGNACSVETSNDSGVVVDSASSPDTIKTCIDLRDNLRKRLAAVIAKIANFKKSFGAEKP